jgi:hypothetical protein
MSQEAPYLDDSPQPTPLEERLVAYLDGELDDVEVREIDGLLATDAKARKLLADLERTWIVLDRIGKSPVDHVFAQTTVEMVATAAAEDVARQEAEIPRRRRRRWLLGGAGVLAAGLAGFFFFAFAWPNPNRELIEDLPVLESLDELERVFSNDDTDIQFLRLLRDHKLFVKDAGDES